MKSFTTLAAVSAAILSLASASAIVQRTPPQQPSCIDFTPYNYKGCYVDAGDPIPALVYRAVGLDSQNTTIEQCVAFCKGNDWKYAGLEYYGICFCGSSVSGAMVDDSKCNTPCGANKTQACGGNGFISIYQDPTFPPFEQTSIADYDSLGCWSDGANAGHARTLNWQQTDIDTEKLTVEMCLNACRDDGYPFAGVEFSKECFCGVVLANGTQQIDSSVCDDPCAGDPTETCGGAGALNLYHAQDLESDTPCKDGQPPGGGSSSSSSSSSSLMTSNAVSSSSSTGSASTTSTTTSSKGATTSSTSSESPTTTTTSKAATSSTSSESPTTTTTSKAATTPAGTTTTTTTTSVAYCTSYTTSTPAPSCEYQVGDWCSSPLPPFSGMNDCKVAVSNCLIQTASCFLKAGFPESLNCKQYRNWCFNVNAYCGASCPGSRCSPSGCKSRYPPQSPGTTPAPVVSSSVYVCSATSAPAKTTTTTSSSIPVPTRDCICEQPHNPRLGYSRDSPCGGIELACMTCNNNFWDYQSGNIFKVYNDPRFSRCPSYTKSSVSQGCKMSCDNQYQSCINTYAESYKQNTKRHGRHSSKKGSNGQQYYDAMGSCKAQWQDCYQVNSNKNAGSKCSSWNNWS